MMSMKHVEHVDSLAENCWCNLIDYSSLLDDDAIAIPSTDHIHWNPQSEYVVDVSMDVTLSETTSSNVSEHTEREFSRKRGRSDSYGGTGTKACRERLRREKLNDRFSELSAVLESGRPVKTDKLAILGDAIRVLNQLKTESKQNQEMNERLLEEIKILKAEKNELREEKLELKADKERIEQQVKAMNVSPTGFVPAHPPVYQPGANKLTMFPGYGLVPMWQYLPPSTRDTSQDHELRPPAA